ncbi:ABC transporter ATP-binding protein [Paracoccus sp. pheM1]|uniref:ABC transporter ATP-binding protein n=1 Tax=Paracoccus sp. pheM1 TaxID=2831675 RepID=UPI001BDB73A3|nr:ABC transporter ATP-binding protein [Paracoccus sp. pheM1]MBT0782903.1 ABC transporter ATP-binding protein [Paracoccus sp. pheM1]
MAFLEITNATKKFGGFVAINDVSFSVERGARYAIIGPNGAGKTTLFNLISGLILPTTGSVMLDGKRLSRMKPHEIVRIGMARSFQKVNVFPRKTAFENVQVALIANRKLQFNPFRGAAGLFRDEVMQLLEQVKLSADCDRRAGELAHGKQKQLELAVALAADPKVLLLDEPTAGMSIAETLSSISLIRDIVQERGITLLFTEHDMNVVFEIASTISVLHHGEIIATGLPHEVRANDDVQRIYLGRE